MQASLTALYFSVLMTMDDVIVHMRKFVIVLLLVDRCLGLVCPYGLFHKSSPSVSLRIYHFYSLTVFEMVFSGCVVCEGGLVGGGLRPLIFYPCVLFFLCILYIFLYLIYLVINNLCLSYVGCATTHVVFGRLVHPVLLVLLCPLGVPTNVSVLCGAHGCGHPVFF